MRDIWERLFGKRPEVNAVVNDRAVPSEQDVLKDVRDYIRHDVATGFDDPAAIVESAIEMFADELDAAVIEPHVRRILAEELAVHAGQQRGWPARTDCDKLDAAFATLEKNGVIARQHFTCCGTCGSTEIWDEMAAVERVGGAARGYAFYHWQDTEAAVDGSGLMLNYGASEEGEAAALIIAREIVAELERHGLVTDWNGSWDKRIGVKLDWKRRRAA